MSATTTETRGTKRSPVPMNGVDTPALFATINAVAAQPELAKFQFRAKSRWVSGTQSQSSMHGFDGARSEQTHVAEYTQPSAAGHLFLGTIVMPRTDVIIVSGGQAGLAMSRSLALRSVDHVVLERGRVGERWHSERWRSLHLLTTNAMSALPGLPHNGRDSDGFMPAQDFAFCLKRYAQAIASPVMSGVEVAKVEPDAGGYRVATSAGEWRSRVVVVATGACETPFRPAAAEALSSDMVQVCPTKYWEPDELPEGGVLVVGASATGLQLAEEIHLSGRPCDAFGRRTHPRAASLPGT